jgi:radical SAM family protein/iron-sulfur cluster protein
VIRITERVRKAGELTGELLRTTPPFPRSAKVELTPRCDMHCRFCASHKRARAARDMSQALFQRTALRLRQLGVEELGLFYIGEPFLCDWLPEAIHYAKKVCNFPYVFLTTNGLTATPDRVRACMLAGLDSLKFAINTATPGQFQAVVGRLPEHHRKTVSNLIAARSMRDEVEKTTGHRCALYASSLDFDGGQRGRMANLLAEVMPFVDAHYWLPLIGEHPLDKLQGSSAPAAKKALPCSGLFKQAHITCDGRLSACSLDASSRFHMADIENETLTAAWHAPAFQALREKHLIGDVTGTVCESCIAYRES